MVTVREHVREHEEVREHVREHEEVSEHVREHVEQETFQYEESSLI